MMAGFNGWNHIASFCTEAIMRLNSHTNKIVSQSNWGRHTTIQTDNGLQ